MLLLPGEGGADGDGAPVDTADCAAALSPGAAAGEGPCKDLCPARESQGGACHWLTALSPVIGSVLLLG